MQQQANLPTTVQAIANVIGMEKTMELVRGKQRDKCRSLYVPAPERMRASHWLIKTIGEEAAYELAAEYAGEPLSIPKCSGLIKEERNRKIIELRRQGLAHHEIAHAMGMSVSSVKTIYYRWMKKQN